MPRKIEPKWGHGFIPLLSVPTDTKYTLDDIQELSELLKSPPSIDELQHKLEWAAHIYLRDKYNYEDAASQPEVKAALNLLNEHATKLLESMKNLDARTWGHVMAPEKAAILKLIDSDDAISAVGHRIVAHKLPDGSKIYDSYEPNDFIESIEVVQKHIKYAHDNFSGKPVSGIKGLALSQWLYFIYEIWMNYSDLTFTTNRHKGIGTSHAFLFAKRAISVLDSGITDSKLTNAMEKYIKRGMFPEK